MANKLGVFYIGGCRHWSAASLTRHIMKET